MELTGQLVDIFKLKAEQVVQDNAQMFFAGQLQSYEELTEDELIDALCFFCDFIEHTSHHNNQDMLCDLSKKFLEIVSTPLGQSSDDIKQTVAYGLGVFGLFCQKGRFLDFIPKCAALMKSMIAGDDAFDDDKIIITESTMGAIAKLCYKHMDGKHFTEKDLVDVLGRMPFTSDDTECCTSHKLFIEQCADKTSVVHKKGVKLAAKITINNIKKYLDDPES